jgi:large subunit ribosomal protein L28
VRVVGAWVRLPATDIVSPPDFIDNPIFGLKDFVMAAVCQVCGKHPSWGMAVSHSHRRTKRRWNPNIQRVRALVNGAPKRLYVCTGCIKAGKIVKAGSAS